VEDGYTGPEPFTPVTLVPSKSVQLTLFPARALIARRLVETFAHPLGCRCGWRGLGRIALVGDCWSFALMRGMLSLQCSGVRCFSLPRARGVKRRGFTSQLAHERDFDRQERRVGKSRACLLQC
jgi:hypothetical protein